MTFGEKLRSLRAISGWTQPQLAERIGIEQSYLSKLENDKSAPSADIFDRITSVFEITPDVLLAEVDPAIIRRHFAHVPLVASQAKRVYLRHWRRKEWLIASAALVVLGTTTVVAGWLGVFFPNTAYSYHAQGGPGFPTSKWKEMTAGLSPEEIKGKYGSHDLISNEYHGERFRRQVAGYERLFTLEATVSVDRMENKLIVIIGALFLAIGTLGILLERRLDSN